MFGLKRMHKQRVRLYERTQVLEKRAKASREKAVDELFDKAISPAGLMASFVLGASTQLDVTKKIRKNLLNFASRDVLSFLFSQVMAYMNAESNKAPTEKEHAPTDPGQAQEAPTDESIKLG